MEFTAQQIAEFLKGKIEGDASIKVSNVAKIEEGEPGTLAFLANPKYEKYLYTTEASIVLINNDLKLVKPTNATLIRVENAYESFAGLLQLVSEAMPQKKGIDPNSYIDPTAKTGKDIYFGAYSFVGENSVIGDQCNIYPQVYIGDNVEIGNNVTLYPGVKIYYGTKIGDNCIIHAGCVIGADGFGFAPQENKEYKKIPQLGTVIIEDNVEIGANATIDRATMGSTIIKKGVKLDNLTQIAHNVVVGENTVIAAQAGIAGSTKIGKNCMFAGQVGIAPHITIADEVKATPQAGIPNNIKKPGSIVMGTPAFDIREFQRSFVVQKQLPDLQKKVRQMEKELEELKNKYLK